MRALLVFVGLVVWVHAASASTVVVLSDPQNAPVLGSALQVTLAGRGVAIATLPAPDGSLRMDRAAAAQHAAIAFSADAALWIDRDVDATEVCVVSADGRFFRHAPLPVGEGDTPRMFAAIATSLLDELLSPDAPAVDVDVHVHVDPHGPQGPVVATIDPPLGGPGVPSMVPMSAPGLAAPDVQQAMRAPVDGRPLMDRTLFEIGPMISPLTIGAEVGLMVPVGDAWRLGGSGSFNALLFPSTSESVLASFAGELRHIGRGRHHFDIGAVGGLALAPERTSDSAPYAGARLAWSWDSGGHGRSLSIVPVLFAPKASEMFPGVYASYRWEIPL
jgi:hypothetical protein